MATNVTAAKRGFIYDPTNSRLALYVDGSEAGNFVASAANLPGTLLVTGNLSSSAQVIGATGVVATAGGVTATAGGVTATAGGITATAGDINGTAGNLRLGAISAFGTTEPTSWAVFKSGTQPAGAIATSGGVGADDTTVQKIIAAGTVSNVET